MTGAPIYFFGCFCDVGHFVYGDGISRHTTEVGPFSIRELDGGLAPKHCGQREDAIRLEYRDGWTALAKWDRSLDHRYGSNCAFVAPGILGEAQMWQLARRHFPAVVERLEKRLGVMP